MIKTLLKHQPKKQPLLVPGVYDCLSALLAKKAGFKAIYLSGGALSVSLLGKPDIGLLTLDEVVSTARRIVKAVSLPLLVDVDTGFGGPLNLTRCVQEMEAAGVAGIQIEDQVFPKRCGHLQGKTVIPTNQMVQKIKSARSARKKNDFLIIARTDARGPEGLKSALKRAEHYKKAGADILFPEALRTREEFRAFSLKKRLGTLLANMTEFGISPSLSSRELGQLGYHVALFPMTAFRRAASAMEEAYRVLHSEGQSRSILDLLQSRQDLYQLLHYQMDAKDRS